MRKSSRWLKPTPEWLKELLKENESPALVVWLDEMASKSPRTLESYSQFLRMFSDYTGLSLQQLYEKREADIESGERLQKRSIERQVKNLMALMGEGVYPWGKGASLDQPMAPATCRQLFKAVNSYFEIFEERDFELYIKKKDLPQGDYNGSSGIMAPQILDMWRVGGEAILRNRASTTFLKDSGIRISDLCALNVGDYQEAKNQARRNESGEPFLVFDPVRTQKCGIVALIHVGPETVSDVDLYLERERPGALDSEPLFAKWELKREGGKKRIDVEDPRMTPGAYSSLYFRLRDVLPKNGRKVSAHSLRKFHKTCLEFNKLHEAWIRRLEGKKIDPYSKQADVLPGKLMEVYMGAYDTLRIHAKPESEKVRDLTRQVSEMRAGETQLREQLAELQEARDAWKAATGVYKRLDESYREAYLAVIKDPSLIPPIRKRMKLEPEDEEAEEDEIGFKFEKREA